MPSDVWEIVNAAMPEALGALLAAAILALVAILWKRISNGIASRNAMIEKAMDSVTSDKVETGDVAGSVDSFSLNESWDNSHQGELGKAENRGCSFKLFDWKTKSDANLDLKRGRSAISSTKGGEFEINTDRVSYKPPRYEQDNNGDDESIKTPPKT